MISTLKSKERDSLSLLVFFLNLFNITPEIDHVAHFLGPFSKENGSSRIPNVSSSHRQINHWMQQSATGTSYEQFIHMSAWHLTSISYHAGGFSWPVRNVGFQVAHGTMGTKTTDPGDETTLF